MQSTPLAIAHPFTTVAWGRTDEEQLVRSVLIARTTDTAARIELVELHRFSQGTSWLGALVDSENRVIEWLECWVQAVQGLEATPAAKCGLLTNSALDLAWNQTFRAMRELNPGVGLAEPLGQRSGDALVIDPRTLALTRLVHRASHKPWVLCRDDAVLKAAGKPAYTTSLERWFQSSNAAGEPVWLEQTILLDPSHPDATDVAAEVGEANAAVPFNVSAGYIAFWRLSPLRLEPFATALRNKFPNTAGSESERKNPPTSITPLEELNRSLISTTSAALVSGAGFFGETSALETFYLRLAFWASTVSETFRATRAIGRPFFNLAADSFRVDLLPAGSLVPRAWSFRTSLVKPGQALSFPVGNPDSPPRFVPMGDLLQSTAAARFGGSASGPGTVRFTQITDGTDGQTRLEGFLDASALRDVAEGACVSVQMSLDGLTVSFVAALETEQGGARAGSRFKATASLPAPAVRQLKTGASPRRPCQLTVLQSVSPAFDVYCLGLVGLQILLTGESSKVTELEDDFFELSALLPRESGVNHLQYLSGSPDANERVRRLLSAREWNSVPEGSGTLPDEVWYATVHELLEFIAVEESNDDDPNAVSKDPIWLQPLARRHRALEALTLHVRGLLSAPQPAHEEISRLVSRFVDTR